MYTALTRAVSPKLGECELTHLDRQPIDIDKCREQHRAYEQCLEKLGCTVRKLPETPEYPDSVFVEDTAVVFPKIGIITRPGAVVRRNETTSMAGVLEEYRDLKFIQPPGTVDGGDVLTLGKTVYIGISSRTNQEGVRQFADHLKPFGYRVEGIRVTGCLHLKTAVAVLEGDRLLYNPQWVDANIFKGYDYEPVHPSEPYGANVMSFQNRALCPAAFPHTQDWLSRHGYEVISLDFSEMAKAEAGLTCCSVIIG